MHSNNTGWPLRRAALVAVVLAGCSAPGPNNRDTAMGSQLPDSATAVRVAADTLARRGARELVVDSIARHGDTLTIWFGPPNRMITDRPATGVSVLRPARVVGIRQIPGG